MYISWVSRWGSVWGFLIGLLAVLNSFSSTGISLETYLPGGNLLLLLTSLTGFFMSIFRLWLVGIWKKLLLTGPKYLYPGATSYLEVAGEAYPQDLADFSLPGLRHWLNQLLKRGFATLGCYSEKYKYYVQSILGRCQRKYKRR